MSDSFFLITPVDQQLATVSLSIDMAKADIKTLDALIAKANNLPDLDKSL